VPFIKNKEGVSVWKPDVIESTTPAEGDKKFAQTEGGVQKVEAPTEKKIQTGTTGSGQRTQLSEAELSRKANLERIASKGRMFAQRFQGAYTADPGAVKKVESLTGGRTLSVDGQDKTFAQIAQDGISDTERSAIKQAGESFIQGDIDSILADYDAQDKSSREGYSQYKGAAGMLARKGDPLEGLTGIQRAEALQKLQRESAAGIGIAREEALESAGEAEAAEEDLQTRKGSFLDELKSEGQESQDKYLQDILGRSDQFGAAQQIAKGIEGVDQPSVALYGPEVKEIRDQNINSPMEEMNSTFQNLTELDAKVITDTDSDGKITDYTAADIFDNPKLLTNKIEKDFRSNYVQSVGEALGITPKQVEEGYSNVIDNALRHYRSEMKKVEDIPNENYTAIQEESDGMGRQLEGGTVVPDYKGKAVDIIKKSKELLGATMLNLDRHFSKAKFDEANPNFQSDSKEVSRKRKAMQTALADIASGKNVDLATVLDKPEERAVPQGRSSNEILEERRNRVNKRRRLNRKQLFGSRNTL